MKWISVKDRLPQTDDEVVLCYFDGHIFQGVVHVRYTNTTVFKMINEPLWYSIPVTYWMPLPEPPTE